MFAKKVKNVRDIIGAFGEGGGYFILGVKIRNMLDIIDPFWKKIEYRG